MLFRHLNLSHICTSILTVFCMLSSEQSTNIAIDPLGISVDKYEVTIDQYKHFLLQTDYTTTYDDGGLRYDYSREAAAWIEVPSASSWMNYMEDQDESLPVTMVSYQDACAYCQSQDGRLPTPEEWESYSGREVVKGNIWHGIFPYRDYGNDGYSNRLSPVGEMPPLENGLHDIYGNAWEYVQSESNLVMAKGGSYLCDFSMCSDTKSKGQLLIYQQQRVQSNIGFRCVYDL